jgi:hypothetical protein
MTIDDLLASTEPILYETFCDEYIYAYSGTCYPVKYSGRLFIVSANHCFENSGISPEQTLYPIPTGRGPQRFFGIDAKYRAKAPEAKDVKHQDQIVLEVAKSHRPEEIIGVSALDLSLPGNALTPTGKSIKDIFVRGFPFEAPQHAIDYDQQIIRKQAYLTNGLVTATKSSFDFCYFIKLIQPIPDGMSPNGMSGTPVYGVTNQGMPVYCGTIIEYNKFDGEYLIISPEILVNTLKKICS